ncbi:leucine efflux protein LeuE [Glaciimonas soli]|uniref:Leucine efflux protein LeuE n=1 Tax=Glaciimonas soli TaxID=2590999 RepID=A0A843YMD7_9BURK|nr:leucine efflux protein LeuE [Glaciimonas soli]MQR01049.1 leucine efflux protein LeuE [Glaciimonas soli]
MSIFFHTLGITDVWQLIAATIVFLMLPGAGTFCILSSASKNGLRAGFSTVAGVMMGDMVLMFLAAIGVAALLHANPLVFKAVQYVGAIYLAYLGFKLLREKKQESSAVGVETIPATETTLKIEEWRRGFFVTLMNPKAIIFYMAFFPLFIDPTMHRGSLTFLTMGMIISSCTLVYGTMLTLVGNAAAKSLARHRRIAAFATKAAGLFLIAFGIKLTTS